MESRTRGLTTALQEARGEKRWSQRDVAARMKLTQAQLSRIESGAADLRLSTFVELARLLDLEPVLVPRSALSGVNAVIRELEADQDARNLRGLTNTLIQLAQHHRKRAPNSEQADRLERLARDLYGIQPGQVGNTLIVALEPIVSHLQHIVHGPYVEVAKFNAAVEQVAQLRNTMLHQPSGERPAYVLDDED